MAHSQTLFKKLSAQRSSAPERLSAEAGAHTFHLLNQGGACFLTLAEKSYPKKLAYQYLEEVSNEFNRLYGGEQIDKVTRPYAFIKFGALFMVSYLTCKALGMLQMLSILTLAWPGTSTCQSDTTQVIV